ncbi:MAG TPA: IMP dehydrogenase [Patescibacteria group bacterium]|nr:IMP dehydrogenase [Patescibacteria group bacterium]
MVDIHSALTFDDVLLKPRYAGFLRSEIDLGVQLTKRIRLQAPLVAAPMDTVTESGLAIALAEVGGIGIIHRNLTIADQTREIKIVKERGLLVGAAVGSTDGYEARVKALVKAGVDVLVVDSAHGHSLKVITALRYIKSNFDVEVIAGNVATGEGAKALIAAGADGLRVGMGPGAICSTRIISGMGVPQMTAIIDTVHVANRYGVPVIADGGIMYSGDITKALAAGASCVMLGRLFAATTEAPGGVTELPAEKVPGRFRHILNGSKSYAFKTYRGMGSLSAMEQGIKISSEDEFHGKNYQNDVLIAEGVEGLVPSSGTVAQLCAQLLGGVQSGMYYVGARTVPELWETAEFMRITQASLTESHPHDLFITDAGDNYHQAS